MTSDRREDPGEQTDFDQRFAEIVAAYGTGDSEPLETPPQLPRDEPQPNSSERSVPDEPLAQLPTQWRMPTEGTASYVVDDGTYEPPAPAPLPRDTQFWSIIGCLVGGPAWLLYLFVFDRYARALWWVLACLLCVLGIVLLVLRQPAERDEFDNDDGAVL